MARTRSIKPSFFKNEVLAELPAEDRLLFIGLWTIADREGRLEDRPRRIKAEIFPYCEIDVDSGLFRLAEAGFILRYGSGYIQVINFLKHQTPHYKEVPSVIPAPIHDQVMIESTSGQRRVNVGSTSGHDWPIMDNPAAPLTGTLLSVLPSSVLPSTLLSTNESLKPETSRVRELPPMDPIWQNAGFDGPEDFEVWWKQVVKSHPNRNANVMAQEETRAMIVKGRFTRGTFETGYAKLAQAQNGSWTKERGKFAPNLLTIMRDGLWQYDPIEPVHERSLAEEIADL